MKTLQNMQKMKKAKSDEPPAVIKKNAGSKLGIVKKEGLQVDTTNRKKVMENYFQLGGVQTQVVSSEVNIFSNTKK